jgi:large subunit ribosomal protein L9
MEVILRQDVDKLGLRGEVVNVARGYARNFLLPRGLAEEATPAKVKELQKRDSHRARNEAQSFDQAREIAEVLEQTVLRFDVKAGPSGSLFGSVTPTDVVDEIWKVRKIRVDRRKIRMENLKRIGRYSTPIELFTDVAVEVKLLVVPEGGELPPEEELEAMEAAERAEAEVAAAQAEAAAPVELEELPEELPEEVPVAETTTGADVPDDAFDRAAGAAVETQTEPES